MSHQLPLAPLDRLEKILKGMSAFLPDLAKNLSSNPTIQLLLETTTKDINNLIDEIEKQRNMVRHNPREGLNLQQKLDCIGELKRSLETIEKELKNTIT